MLKLNTEAVTLHPLYNWSVDFTVTDSAGATVATNDVTTCEAVEPSYPMYGPLGVTMTMAQLFKPMPVL